MAFHGASPGAAFAVLTLTMSALPAAAAPKSSAPLHQRPSVDARSLRSCEAPAGLLPGDGILPADRRIDWSLAGIPRGVPGRSTIGSTIDAAVYGDGRTDATAAIQGALDACPDGEVVYLPAGTYLISDTIHLRDHDTLRGAGPGRTILKYAGGGWLRSMVDLRGSVWWQVTTLHKVQDILAAVKDSRMVTLADASGISPGDILLLNQRNDGTVVDPVGVEGPCTWCGYENGERTLGQLAEVVAVNGGEVELNLPLHWTHDPALDPWAYQIDASAMVRHAGLEDLTLTQDSPDVEFMIEMDGAQYCWVRNVEIVNVQRRAMWMINSLQNHISQCYLHLGIDGYGRDRGYGILLDLHSSNNRVEDNILSTIDGGGVMTAGGASGNVIAHNYLHNISFDDPWWLIGSPSLNHGPHPKMNLWEGNHGSKADADIIHGSSSHNTLFRSRSTGWQSDTITTRNNAIEIAARNTSWSVVGSVLGTAGRSNRYQVLPGEPYDDWTELVIWVLGVASGVDDPSVAATLLRHGNHDYFTGAVAWDPAIPERTLPASLYLDSMPAWWCIETPWPAIGPDVVGYTHSIPARRRFEGLPCTPLASLCPAGLPGRIRELRMARSGADLVLTWTPDSGAGGGYNLYTDTDRASLSSLRSPAHSPIATRVQAPHRVLDGIAAGKLYWQVLGVCADGLTEGPN